MSNSMLFLVLIRYSHVLSCFQRFPGPLVAKKWKKLEKVQKIWFFMPFQWMDMAIFKPVICSSWPNMVLIVSPRRYSRVLSCFQRFPRPLFAKKWKKFEKMQKCWFSGHLHSVQGHFRVLEFDPWAQFWYSLGPWWGFGICKVVS